MYKLQSWGFLAVALAVFALGISFTPNASADTLFIGASAATACGGSTMCMSGSAYSITDLLNGSESISSYGTYLVDNDTGIGTLSGTFNQSIPFNDSLECQVTGMIDGSATTCSISGALGTVGGGTIYGPSGLTSGTWNPDATITFNYLPTCGVVADACMFDVTIADVAAKMPEPSSFVLLSIGFAGLFGLAYWKLGASRLGVRA